MGLLETIISDECVKVFHKYNALLPKRQIDPYSIKIIFTKRGTSAGSANWFKRTLNFNPILAEENLPVFLAQTVPHEIAHLYADKIYPNSRGHHGRQWKNIMLLGGYPPERCHNYDTSSIRKQFDYTCECPGKVHKLSTVRHNKMMRDPTRYRCRTCKSVIVATDDTLLAGVTNSNKKGK